MRRLLAVCALGLALPVLVQAATSPVVAAAKRTAAAKSLTLQISMTTTVAGQRTTMTGSGAQKGSSARLTMRMRAQGVTFRIDAILVQERAAYVVYLRSPLFQPQLPPGKSWLRIDLSKQAASLGLDFSSLASASQTSAPLEKGLVSTTRLGRQVVAGKPTTRYRAIVDVRRAARALPAYGAQIAAVERLTGIRLGRLPYDVWIAGDGRIRRVRLSLPTVSAGVRGKVIQTLTFLAFDVPVTIEAPPAARVFTP